MADVAEFDPQRIQQAIDAAKKHGDEMRASLAGDTHGFDMNDGELSLTAHCLSVTVENHKICINLPSPISKHLCLPIPAFVPNGTAAQVCLAICTHWGIPTGIRITVVALNHQLLSKTFGFC